jgi:hypothetical protein
VNLRPIEFPPRIRYPTTAGHQSLAPSSPALSTAIAVSLAAVTESLLSGNSPLSGLMNSPAKRLVIRLGGGPLHSAHAIRVRALL